MQISVLYAENQFIPPISKDSSLTKETAGASTKLKSSSDYVVIDETRFKTNAFLIFSIACILVINPLLYLLIQHRIVSQTYTEYMLYIFVGGVVSAIVDSLITNTDIRDKIKDSLCAVAIWVVYFCMAFKRRNKPWWYGLLLTIAITVVDYIIAFVIVFLASSGGVSSFDSVPSKVSVFDWMDSKFSGSADISEVEINDSEVTENIETVDENDEVNGLVGDYRKSDFDILESYEYTDTLGYKHYIDIVDCHVNKAIKKSVVLRDDSNKVVYTCEDIINVGDGNIGLIDINNYNLDESLDIDDLNWTVNWDVYAPLVPYDLSSVSVEDYNISGEYMYVTLHTDDVSSVGIVNVNALLFKGNELIDVVWGITDDISDTETVVNVWMYEHTESDFDTVKFIID